MYTLVTAHISGRVHALYSECLLQLCGGERWANTAASVSSYV